MKDLFFTTEKETENAVFDLIARGSKFHTAGSTHIIVYEEDAKPGEDGLMVSKPGF